MKIRMVAAAGLAFAAGMFAESLKADFVPTGWAQATGAPVARLDESQPMMLGTGGSSDHKNDIAWVLTMDVFEDPKTKVKVPRKVLLCYKVGKEGKFVDIVDVRDITWDSKFEQLPVPGHNEAFTPDKMRKAADAK